MALPYDYIFDSDIPLADNLNLILRQRQVRFILSALQRYTDGQSFVDQSGNVVTLTDDEQAIIDDTWGRLMRPNW